MVSNANFALVRLGKTARMIDGIHGVSMRACIVLNGNINKPKKRFEAVLEIM